MGYSLRKYSRLHLYADYLFHVKNIFNTSENMVLARRLRLGFRFDVGLVWIIRNAPVDVFLEIAPLLDIIPSTDFTVNGGIGVRFFFN